MKVALACQPVTEVCGVLKTSDRSLLSESDSALPVKLIHSRGVVLVLSTQNVSINTLSIISDAYRYEDMKSVLTFFGELFSLAPSNE